MKSRYDKTGFDPEPIHSWFLLSYAQYLTIPRSILQSMPQLWQARFVRCLEELDEAIDWRPKGGCYWVTLNEYLEQCGVEAEPEILGKGPELVDPLQDYERGRRRIAIKKISVCEAWEHDLVWLAAFFFGYSLDVITDEIHNGEWGEEFAEGLTPIDALISREDPGE